MNVLQVGCFAAERRSVVNDLKLNFFAGVVNNRHERGRLKLLDGGFEGILVSFVNFCQMRGDGDKSGANPRSKFFFLVFNKERDTSLVEDAEEVR